MTSRPPSSTLFPYTTLFRSIRARERESKRRATTRPAAYAKIAAHSARQITADGEPESGALRGLREAAIDRKSTRLNSSHVEISYAVFCLKKKKPKAISAPPL